MCKESVCGRCYWEVESSAVMYILVSYKRSEGKDEVMSVGLETTIKSWYPWCSPLSFLTYFWHNSMKTMLNIPPSSRMITEQELCLSTMPLIQRSSSTGSTPHSLSLYTVHRVLGSWHYEIMQSKVTILW